jgi:segregation and condensation protein B
MGDPTTFSPADAPAAVGDGPPAHEPEVREPQVREPEVRVPSVLDRAVEALAFAAEAPLAPAEAARIVAAVTGADTSAADVEAAVGRLNAAYAATGRTFRIQPWGGGLRLATEPEVAPFVRTLLAKEEEGRLSRALVETLAVVAYRQPVTKPEVDFVRGVNTDYALRQLLEKDLLAVVGRAESVGRPLLYGTTERFLDLFGLGTLEELPRPREVEELLADPQFSRERALLAAEAGLAPPPDPVLPDPVPPGAASPAPAPPAHG